MKNEEMQDKIGKENQSSNLSIILKLSDKSYILVCSLVHELTGLPQEILHQLAFSTDNFYIPGTGLCKKCGWARQNCHCKHKNYYDVICNMTIAQESREGKSIHSGPTKLDGTPDWRYHSHEWRTVISYVYSFAVTSAEGALFELKLRLSNSFTNIHEHINRFNILLKVLHANEPFKNIYCTFIEKVHSLKELKDTATELSKKLSQLKNLLSQVQADDIRYDDLYAAEVSTIKEAKSQERDLERKIDTHAKNINDQTDDIKTQMSEMKKLYESLLESYDEIGLKSKRNSLAELDAFLENK